MRWLLAGLALALSAGCGTFRPVGRSAPRLEVPISRQEDKRSCGMSVAEMLAGYYRRQIAPDDLRRLEELSREQGGVEGRTLKEVLQKNGFEVYIFAGDLLDRHTPRGITYHLDRGRPVVVMLGGRAKHYALLTGLDLATEEVFLADPARGAVRCARAAFMKMWEAAGRFALLAVPASEGG